MTQKSPTWWTLDSTGIFGFDTNARKIICFNLTEGSCVVNNKFKVRQNITNLLVNKLVDYRWKIILWRTKFRRTGVNSHVIIQPFETTCNYTLPVLNLTTVALSGCSPFGLSLPLPTSTIDNYMLKLFQEKVGHFEKGMGQSFPDRP